MMTEIYVLLCIILQRHLPEFEIKYVLSYRI